MILLVGSQKGGCGKSTLATNLAAGLAANGEDVVLVDADRQGTASNWAADRAEDASLPTVHTVQKYDNIRDTLRDLAGRYGVVIVDAAGRDSRELRTGMTVADVLLVPFRPSQADLDTLPALQEIIDQATDLNPELKVCALLTMTPTNPSVTEAEQAREYLANYPRFEMLAATVADRKVYRDAISEGKGVTEMGNPKAAAEIETLLTEVRTWLG